MQIFMFVSFAVIEIPLGQRMLITPRYEYTCTGFLNTIEMVESVFNGSTENTRCRYRCRCLRILCGDVMTA